MVSMDMSKALDVIYANRDKFIIIGLTGRTGAGCSFVASVLASQIREVLSEKQTVNLNDDNNKRKDNIVKEYIEKNWSPFFVIKVRDIISTFILDHTYDEVVDFVHNVNNKLDFSPMKEMFEEVKNKRACLNEVLNDKHDDANANDVYKFLSRDIGNFTDSVKQYFEGISKDECIRVYQIIGDNIRLYGNAIGRGEADGNNIYAISARINLLVKGLRNYNKQNSGKDYFVIDAFRNPIEVKFFQERFSAFYLWAINAPDEDRKDRLIHNLKMDIDEINRLDAKEYSENDYLKGRAEFVSQNIGECIQSADVFVRNVGDHTNTNFELLYQQILKYISLIKHPGIVTPSRDERCMQVAGTAKLNSGCISRQVGAAIADEFGFVRAIGWNDAPRGQTPCLLKSCYDLMKNHDDRSYSKYEKTCKKFKEIVKDYYDKLKAITGEKGITLCYCFKDIQNEIDGKGNQVHTRSLHAEENAFLSLINGSGSCVRGGTLYTTSSPCVLCAKKAYQLGVKRVVYVDRYPDISFDHIFAGGSEPPVPELYSGALGAAFYKLYQPIVPLKDELNALSC